MRTGEPGVWHVLLLGAWISLLGGCETGSSITDAVGTWRGDYGEEGHETIIIRPNGIFEQTLERAGEIVYRNQGTWTIKIVRRDYYIAFADIMRPAPEGNNVGPRPQFFDSALTTWSPETGVISLWMSPERWVKRVTTAVPAANTEFPRMRNVYRHNRMGNG